MKIVFQEVPEETATADVAAFLSAKGIAPGAAVVEIDGEVFPREADLSGIAVREGMAVNAFRFAAGG